MYHRVKCVQVVSWWSWNSRLKYLYFSKKKIKISRSGAVRLPFGQNEALVTRCRGWVRVLLCITCRCRKVTLCPHQYDFDGSNRAYTMQKKKIKYDSYTSCGGAIFTVKLSLLLSVIAQTMCVSCYAGSMLVLALLRGCIYVLPFSYHFFFTKICTSYSIHSGGYPKY